MYYHLQHKRGAVSVQHPSLYKLSDWALLLYNVSVFYLFWTWTFSVLDVPFRLII